MSDHDRAIHIDIDITSGQLNRLIDRLCCGEKLDLILHKLERLNKMATLDDLNTAVASVRGVLTANDARVAGLAQAVSDAASSAAARDADLNAQIVALQAQVAAGSTDPVALGTAVNNLVAMSNEGVAEGAAIDAATTALAAAFPKSAPAPTP